MKKINLEVIKTVSIALLFIVMLVINFYITFKLIPTNTKGWYEINILRHAGFGEFWFPKEGDCAVHILSFVLALCGGLVISVLIFGRESTETNHDQTSEHSRTLGGVIGITTVIFTMILFFVIRTLIALLSYVVLYILSPIGSFIISGVFILLMILVARDMSKKRYILRFWLNVASSIVVAISFYFIGSNIVNGNISVEDINCIFPFLELIKYE